MASFSSWPCGLVRGCCLRWLTFESYFNNEYFTENVVPTPGWVLVLASRLMYENMAHSWLITGPLCLDKLAVYTLQLVTPHPSRLHRLGRLSGHIPILCTSHSNSSQQSDLCTCSKCLHTSFVAPSTSETDGPFSSPQRVLPLRAPFRPSSPCSISPPVSWPRYVWFGTVAGDGAPRSLSAESLQDLPFFAL